MKEIFARLTAKLRYALAMLNDEHKRNLRYGLVINAVDVTIIKSALKLVIDKLHGLELQQAALIGDILTWHIKKPSIIGNWHCVWLTIEEIDLVEWGIILHKGDCRFLLDILETYLSSLEPKYQDKGTMIRFFSNPPKQFKVIRALHERIFQYQRPL